VAFSPDGRFIVTACADNTARVWEADTGTAVSPPMPHSDPVLAAVFSPQGNRVLSFTNAAARVWSPESGKPLSPPLRPGQPLVTASFIGDGRRVVTASVDGSVRVWDLEPDAHSPADIIREVELMSSHRIDSTGGIVPLTVDEIYRHWETLRRSDPASFSASPSDIRRWREAEIRNSLKQGNLAAARFHHWARVYDLATAGGGH
jgi:WD40 repeat protein